MRDAGLLKGLPAMQEDAVDLVGHLSENLSNPAVLYGLMISFQFLVPYSSYIASSASLSPSPRFLFVFELLLFVATLVARCRLALPM